jgi:hypothetical protein
VIADADVAGGADGPLDLDDAAFGWWQQRRPGRDGTAGDQPGNVLNLPFQGWLLPLLQRAGEWQAISITRR